MKSRGLVVTIVVLGVLVLFLAFLWGMGMYNSIVSLDESVVSAWGQVENQYQRRADLIPNLVATVKGYAAQEKEVLEGVTEARARATQVNVTKEVLDDPVAFERFREAQDNLSSAISRLLAVVENYPVLRSNENFLTLQDQLEGTENRISAARKRFNEFVLAYNTAIRTFPGSVVAGFGGFQEKEYFSADQGAGDAPAVQF